MRLQQVQILHTLPVQLAHSLGHSQLRLLHKLDAVAACGGVLLGLEVVQRHPKLPEDVVAQILQLACHTGPTWGATTSLVCTCQRPQLLLRLPAPCLVLEAAQSTTRQHHTSHR